MTRLRRVFVLAASLLVGCATSPPFPLEGTDLSLTPIEAVQRPEALRGQRVVWGGMIVANHNLESATELEVLAYPLDHAARPKLNARPLRRFLISYPGYLESVDYAPGRLVTAIGSFERLRPGKVGKTSYDYPVLAAGRLHLWPRNYGAADSGVRFGVGVGVIVH